MARFQLERGPIPLHHQVFRDLKSALDAHEWRPGDLVMWDNRAVLHRATYYDTVKYKRFMQRTTIGGDLPTVPQ